MYKRFSYRRVQYWGSNVQTIQLSESSVLGGLMYKRFSYRRVQYWGSNVQTVQLSESSV